MFSISFRIYSKINIHIYKSYDYTHRFFIHTFYNHYIFSYFFLYMLRYLLHLIYLYLDYC